MFRPGNKKEQTHGDETADYTPQTPSSQSYGGSQTAASSSGAAGASSDYSAATAASGRAVTESESLARDIKEGTLSGFVGNGTTLTGEANFKGMLRVDGHLSGRVSSSDGTLIVSNNGQVDANVEVAVAQIFGTVNGDIIASKRIEMGRVARVNGNIQTPALVIENGATFEGSCRMVALRDAQENEKKADSAPKSETATSAAASSSTPSTPSSSSSSSSSTSSGSTSTPSSSSAYGSSSSSKDKGASGSSSVTDATGAVS
ncbi:MAG TPA: polymer-forming cytoskeletal protein [Pyrinomonadaceae bacterium]|nr:polymer-forming cytoskeletal protein [Pyrinomonadaceae bacterium]